MNSENKSIYGKFSAPKFISKMPVGRSCLEHLSKPRANSFKLLTIPLRKKNCLKPFGESLFKTVKNYSNYSPMLNWRTIGGTVEINGQKLLKCSNYSPFLI